MELENALLHLKQDVKLNELIEIAPPPEFQTAGNIYYDLLESVVSQQLSLKVARVLFSRFCALFPDAYPHPELVNQLSVEQLRRIGLSAQKASYLKNIAQFGLQTDLVNYAWANMEDEEIIRFLTEIKGVGRWTVQMILMFSMGRPDVFPVDDLGVQQAMIGLYSLDGQGRLLKKQMDAVAEPWKPYRSYASWYLWRWKEMQNRGPDKSP
jgi:DNA-3-methyladenine glycosylase II